MSVGENDDGYEEVEVDPKEVSQEDDDLRHAWRQVQKNAEGEANDPVRVIRKYLPDPEDWGGKTDISLNQAVPMATVPEFDTAFYNICGDGIHSKLDEDGILQEFQRLLTSVEGKSREDFVEILRSLQGTSDSTEVNVNSADVDDPSGE